MGVDNFFDPYFLSPTGLVLKYSHNMHLTVRLAVPRSAQIPRLCLRTSLNSGLNTKLAIKRGYKNMNTVCQLRACLAILATGLDNMFLPGSCAARFRPKSLVGTSDMSTVRRNAAIYLLKGGIYANN